MINGGTDESRFPWPCESCQWRQNVMNIQSNCQIGFSLATAHQTCLIYWMRSLVKDSHCLKDTEHAYMIGTRCRTNTYTFIMKIHCKSRTELSLNFWIHFGKHHPLGLWIRKFRFCSAFALYLHNKSTSVCSTSTTGACDDISPTGTRWLHFWKVPC